MGVVVYGLLNGKFPFRDEKDIASKSVTVPKGTPEECRDFVLSILEKNESKRADHKAIMASKWIKGAAGTSHVDDNSEEFKPDADAFAEGGANHGIQERRADLMERMQEAGQKKNKPADGKKPEEHYWKEWFSIVDRHAKNSTLRYEWWSQSKVDESKILNTDGAKASQEGKSNQTQVVGDQLRSHGIDTNKFGQGSAKSLEQLAAEVQSGAAVLMLDATTHKKLVRVVDVVLLRICAPKTKDKFLVETGEKFSDGRERNICRLPGTKKEPHLNTKQMAEKIVAELLNMGDGKVTFDYNLKEVFEEQEESPSYPGVVTVYRKEIVEGTLVVGGDDYIGKTPKGPKDWNRQDKTGNTKYFAWMKDKDCIKNGVKYKAPEEGEDVSGLVQAPIGLDEEQLTAFFSKNRVDTEKFGKNNAKTLKDISGELIKGESALMVETDGSVLRVVDVVVIKLIHSVTNSILVQTEQKYPNGETVSLKRLPGAKRRPDENQFLTARRILKRQLKVEENHVSLDAANVLVVEEDKDSLAYPGLRTIYRKRIITATLAKENQ
jgi:hypothetical protein